MPRLEGKEPKASPNCPNGKMARWNHFVNPQFNSSEEMPRRLRLIVLTGFDGLFSACECDAVDCCFYSRHDMYPYRKVSIVEYWTSCIYCLEYRILKTGLFGMPWSSERSEMVLPLRQWSLPERHKPTLKDGRRCTAHNWKTRIEGHYCYSLLFFLKTGHWNCLKEDPSSIARWIQ